MSDLRADLERQLKEVRHRREAAEASLARLQDEEQDLYDALDGMQLIHARRTNEEEA